MKTCVIPGCGGADAGCSYCLFDARVAKHQERWVAVLSSVGYLALAEVEPDPLRAERFRLLAHLKVYAARRRLEL